MALQAGKLCSVTPKNPIENSVPAIAFNGNASCTFWSPGEGLKIKSNIIYGFEASNITVLAINDCSGFS